MEPRPEIFLQHHGLTNYDSTDLAGMHGHDRDRRAVYCSSNACAKGSTRGKGELVHLGENYVKACPVCKDRRFLFFETLSKHKADRIAYLLRRGDGHTDNVAQPEPS